MELPDRSQAKSWEGRDVVDRDGQRLGRCVGVFADTATGVPEWLHVDVEGHVRSFVPALEAAESDGAVRVRFAREAVLAAPSVGDDDQLSKAEEIDLYRHYGVPVDTDEGSVLPAGDATAAGGTAASGAPAPVAGISDRTSTGAASSSGADTSVAETDAAAPEGRQSGGDTTALTPTSTGPVDDDHDVMSPLADADTVSGGVVTPETGEQLPVLDPAVASTPVPEDQVTYVDRSADVEPDEPATEAAPPVEQPRPALRRVPPASPPPPAAPPSAAPSSGGSGLSALTPLGAVAGVAAAVALVLRARDRRGRRRVRTATRAGRLGSSLRAGSAGALASASSSLASVPDAAAQTRRAAAVATAKAARAAAQRQKRAAAAARRQRSQTAAALAVAAKAATQHKHTATTSLGAASKAAGKTAAQQRRAAKASLAAARKAAAQQRKAAKASLSAASSRGSSAADTVVAVPRRVAKRGRKVRKSLFRKVWNTIVLATAGGGYVLGAKAGRQRYDELAQVAAAVAESPKVQSVTQAVTDPERRSDLLAEVQQQASALVGRRGEPRS